MSIKYLKPDRAKMKLDNGKEIELLWGDRIRVISQDATTSRVRARGREGTVKNTVLGDKSLLEFYFIDVGQGDGILIRTPDNRHILIDAGFNRSMQPTGKNAADFVDWKFVKDYEMKNIELDAMIVSHNDADHYGGLWDLLNPSKTSQDELDADKTTVENFYHAGIAWWEDSNGKKTLGKFEPANGELFYTQLMGDRQEVENALQNGVPQKFFGNWEKFMKCVAATKRRDGQPTPIERLCNKDGFVPDFAPATNNVSAKVFAPVEHSVNGKPAIRKLEGTDDKNTNGNSILLRIDYGKVRVLLTGDLNTVSQRALMNDYQGQMLEFACDVGKGCHHGSDDISFKFLQAMCPAVTVISSGDSNGHDHPRPSIVGASAVTGFFQLDSVNDVLISPLIYSTELARSIEISRPTKLLAVENNAAPLEITGSDLDKSVIEYKKSEQTRKKNLNSKSRIVSGLIYGLVNVRTDGEKILCATLNESDYKWDIKTINSRF